MNIKPLVLYRSDSLGGLMGWKKPEVRQYWCLYEGHDFDLVEHTTDDLETVAQDYADHRYSDFDYPRDMDILVICQKTGKTERFEVEVQMVPSFNLSPSEKPTDEPRYAVYVDGIMTDLIDDDVLSQDSGGYNLVSEFLRQNTWINDRVSAISGVKYPTYAAPSGWVTSVDEAFKAAQIQELNPEQLKMLGSETPVRYRTFNWSIPEYPQVGNFWFVVMEVRKNVRLVFDVSELFPEPEDPEDPEEEAESEELPETVSQGTSGGSQDQTQGETQQHDQTEKPPQEPGPGSGPLEF